MFKKLLIVISVLLWSPHGSEAQSLDLTYNLTRAFDIPSEQWMGFHVVGAEVQTKGFTFGSSLFLDANTREKSEGDLSVRWDRNVEWLPKLNVSVKAGWNRYFMDFLDPKKQRKSDWLAGVEFRYRLIDR